jgi:HK97 gp10 family phage protein
VAYEDALAELRNIEIALDTTGPYKAAKVDKLVISTAHLVEAGGKRRAPVDTGAMRSSIGVDITRHGEGPGWGTEAEIGPTVSYAPFVEEGTERQPPQPFMGPALDEVEPAFVAALESLVDPFEGRP